jgi:hypothetical protein
MSLYMPGHNSSTWCIIVGVVLCAFPKTFLAIDLAARMDIMSQKSTIVFVAENYTHTLCLGLCALSDQASGRIYASREKCVHFYLPRPEHFTTKFPAQSLKPHKSFLQLPHFIMRCTFIPGAQYSSDARGARYPKVRKSFSI